MVAVLYASTTLLLALLLFFPSVAPQVTETAPSHMTDASALILLKSSFSNATALSSWSASSPSHPCDGPSRWLGVVCDHGIIVGLRLSGLGLSGSIDVAALSHFKGLRTISLNNNSFSGPLPAALGSLGALKSLFLSHNHFSGPIADDLFREMRRLKKLWLDHNDFSGPIPSSLSNARPLIELRLDNNDFEGAIPALEIHSLALFDASNNHLTGPVPASLARFNASSFAGNQGLCGPPVDSKPCPSATAPMVRVGGNNKNVSIAVATLLLVFVVLLGVYVGVRKERKTEDFDKLGVASSFGSMEEAVAVSMASPFSIGSRRKLSVSSRGRKGHGGGEGTGGESTDLVVVNEEKGVFRLSDLMKANAEVLGNGGLGSAYKAVMSNHLSVAVKRMRDMNQTDKDGFDSQMRRLGGLRHPNVLTPLAYHYRREEKLIISEYVPKGSLLYILHGDRGRDHKALDWMTRVRIARGIARGLAYLHRQLGEGLAAECAPHGNMKSGNILLREDFEPMLVDFGLEGLVNQAQAPTAMFAYKSPEGQQHRRVSAKSDVFCLGVVLLELITGKFPSQYLNNTRGGTDVVQWATSALAEERELELVDQDMAGAKQAWGIEMARFLKLGVTCTETDVEKRPEIAEVAELLEEIAAAVGVPPGPDGAAAIGASPALLTDELI